MCGQARGYRGIRSLGAAASLPGVVAKRAEIPLEVQCRYRLSFGPSLAWAILFGQHFEDRGFFDIWK